MPKGKPPVDGTGALEMHTGVSRHPVAKSLRTKPIRSPSLDRHPSRPLLSDDSLEVRVATEAAAGLALLLEAHIYCESLGQNAWDFAVEILSLRRVGLTNSTLRWMVCKGWLSHAQEVSGNDADRRVFREGALLAFDRTTCFVLTKSGIEAARHACQVLSAGQPLAVVPLSKQNLPAMGRRGSSDFSICPSWDPELHQLRIGELLVKEFKLPCPNQGTVLMAFEEDGWPKRIDDPLPPRPELDSRTRLRYTIKSLNKNQKNRLIRFMGDGTGQGVRWQFRPDARLAWQD